MKKKKITYDNKILKELNNITLNKLMKKNKNELINLAKELKVDTKGTKKKISNNILIKINKKKYTKNTLKKIKLKEKKVGHKKKEVEDEKEKVEDEKEKVEDEKEKVEDEKEKVDKLYVNNDECTNADKKEYKNCNSTQKPKGYYKTFKDTSKTFYISNNMSYFDYIKIYFNNDHKCRKIIYSTSLFILGILFYKIKK